jgi:hypothetical protein
MEHPASKRALNVANKLFDANKQIPEIAQMNWTLTMVDDPDVVNACAMPVRNLFKLVFWIFYNEKVIVN